MTDDILTTPAIKARYHKTTGLREALNLLNTFHAHLREEGQTEGPYWVSTNALIQEIAWREGRSMKDVADELRIPDAKAPSHPEADHN